MAKRLTDTDKYKKHFFRGLQGAYKLLWDYLYHSCDHAGIWHVDFEVAQIYLGKDMLVNEKDSLEYFGKKIIVFDDGQKWFIPSFIEFQYKNLNPANKVHNSVIDILNREGLLSSLNGAKDKDKDKLKDKVKAKDKKKENPPYLKEKDFDWYLNDCNWLLTTASHLKMTEERLKEWIEKIRDTCVSKGFTGNYRYYDLKATIRTWRKRELDNNKTGEVNMKAELKKLREAEDAKTIRP